MDLIISLQLFGHKMATVAEKSMAHELPVNASEMPTLFQHVKAGALYTLNLACTRCRERVMYGAPTAPKQAQTVLNHSMGRHQMNPNNSYRPRTAGEAVPCGHNLV